MNVIARLSVCVVMLGLCAQAMALPLVQNGKATGEFIMPPDVHKAHRYAIGDVRHWIHQMTDVYVPILDAPSKANNTKVFIGKVHASSFTSDLKAIGTTDGYAIRSKGKHIYVFGTRPRGTLFGLYGLLERNSDIIWARPNRRFGTIHGKHTSLTLTETNVRDIPAFSVRYQGGDYRPHHDDTLLWQIRNLSNQTKGEFKDLDMVRSFHDIPYWLLGRTLKDKNYIKTHPEIFSYQDKFKARDARGVCYMNPKLDEIYFPELIKRIEDYEKKSGVKVQYINSHMGDSWQCCDCKLCTAPIKLPDGSLYKMTSKDPYKDPQWRSTQYYMFYSRIMERLKKVRPDIDLVVLAYIYSAPDPKVPPHPDLKVIFAPYPTSNMHFPMDDPRQNATWRNRWNNWQKLTKRFGMREYYNASTISPISWTAQADMKTILKTQDAKEVVTVTETRDDLGVNGDPGWDVSTMQMWLIQRMFWNPNQDLHALRKQFIERTYREAASPMTKFYDLILKSWNDPKDKTIMGWHAGHAGVYDSLIVKKGLEKELLDHLRKALSLVKHPNAKVMITRMYDNLRSVNQAMSKLMIADIPEMAQDGDQFISVQWEKPLELTNYRRPYLYKQPNHPGYGSEIRAGHDGRNLYVKFDLESADLSTVEAVSKGSKEVFPLNDHMELWFYGLRKNYVFAFNYKGAMYDAKDLDSSWNSNWKLKTRKTNKGWEAIAVIPLEALELKRGKKTSLKWSSMRETKIKGKPSEINIYGGMALHDKQYPVVMD